MNDPLRFVYHALVYVFEEGTDKPEVCHAQSVCSALQFPLDQEYVLIEDLFETNGLAPGVYSVWIEGGIEFYVYQTGDGPEHDMNISLTKQEWEPAKQGDLDYILAPDTPPVMVFYSLKPAPVPNWFLFATAKPHNASDDAPPTHNFWRRLDDDNSGRTIYQCSKVEDKIPDLSMGAYYSYEPLARLKGLVINILIS